MFKRIISQWGFARSTFRFAMMFAALVQCLVPSQAVAGEITVYVASSLGYVIEELGQMFTAVHDQHHIRLVVASSSTLASQIMAGAPAHVFISANRTWMSVAVQARRITGESVKPLAGNSLVLVSYDPSGSLASTHAVPSIDSGFPLRQLLGHNPDNRLAMGDPDHVPAGQYARQALEKLGLWQSVADRLAPMPDARATLNMVARNQTPYAVVYASDVRLSTHVRVVATFPPESHRAIRYLAGRVTGSVSGAADDFMAFLVSERATAVYEKYGFCQNCP